jgi:membrane-associated protein
MMIPFLHFDVQEFIVLIGYFGLFAIVFAESGLFFCFFLPGGSMLFTAGLLASQGLFNIYLLIFIIAAAAILGDSVGYWFGWKVGPKIFNKEDSRFFNKKNLNSSKEFYEKYGAWAIIFGRFVPIARTFVPILAGVGTMNYKKFLYYNILGGILWSGGMSMIGFTLGKSFPNMENYLLPVIIVIVVLSIIPLLFKARAKHA